MVKRISIMSACGNRRHWQGEFLLKLAKGFIHYNWFHAAYAVYLSNVENILPGLIDSPLWFFKQLPGVLSCHLWTCDIFEVVNIINLIWVVNDSTANRMRMWLLFIIVFCECVPMIHKASLWPGVIDMDQEAHPTSECSLDRVLLSATWLGLCRMNVLTFLFCVIAPYTQSQLQRAINLVCEWEFLIECLHWFAMFIISDFFSLICMLLL